MDNAKKLELLDKLDEMIYSGVLEIEFSDRKLKYRSLSELERVRSKLYLDLNPSKKVKSTIVPIYSSGL